MYAQYGAELSQTLKQDLLRRIEWGSMSATSCQQHSAKTESEMLRLLKWLALPGKFRRVSLADGDRDSPHNHGQKNVGWTL